MSIDAPSALRVLAALKNKRMPQLVMTNPSKYGLMPVEVVFGVVRDRPGQQVLLSGEQVRNSDGEIFYLVGVDHRQRPYLAKTEHELSEGKKAIERMRLQFYSDSGPDARRVAEAFEAERVASVDTFLTTEGKLKFKMDTKEFAQFLSSQGIRGGAAGSFLRGEDTISEDMLKLMVGSDKTTNFGYGGSEKYDVKIIGGPRVVAPGQTRRSPLPDIQRVWDALVKAIWKETSGGGSDAGDMFVNMGDEQDDDDFEQYLAGVSGDVAQSYQYALSGPADELYRKLYDMIKTGEYTGGTYDNWTWRYRDQILREVYADAWHSGMIKGWQKIENNPKELARLKAMRAR